MINKKRNEISISKMIDCNQKSMLPGGGFHGGEQIETLPGGGFH